MLHVSSTHQLDRRLRLLLSIAVLAALLGAISTPAPGLAQDSADPIISLSSADASACSDDENASCETKLLTVDFTNTASYEFDCHGSPVHVPWFKALAALLGIDIPWWIPDPTPDSAICTYLAQGSTFKVYESGNPNPIVDKTYTGWKQEGQFTVQPNHTYELKLNGHGRDFREIMEANGLTFDSFANVTYQEIDPNDDICRNAIPFDLPYSGNLEFSGDHDWQRIQSPVKGTMVLTLDVPPDKDYQLEVWNDACSAIWVLSQNGTGMDEQFVMPVDQAYYRVHVFGRTTADFGAWYSVSALWDMDDNQWENAAPFNPPFQGNLEYSGDRDWQKITVPAAGTILVLDVPDGKNYELELWRDDVKTKLAESKNSSGIDEFILIAQPGTYRIHIYGMNPAMDFNASYGVSLIVDNIAPVSAIALSGTAGTNGWYRSNVQVTLSATDNPGGSGVQNIEYGFNYTPWNPFTGPWIVYSNPFTISAEGHTYLEFRSTDNVGNVASNQKQVIRIDTVAPEISGSIAPPPNTNGWHHTNVTVGFTATDFQSGIASLIPMETTLTNEGAGQSVTGTVIDNAGNSTSQTMGNINIDKTPPTLAIVSPKAAAYTRSSSLIVAWTVLDNLSGIQSTSAWLDNQPVVNGQGIDLYALRLGPHTVTLQAKDKADNTASLSVTFTLTANINSLQDTISHVYDLGWIDKQGVYTSLNASLKAAQASMARNQLNAARNQLMAFLNKLEAQKGRAINQQAYDLLKADVLYVLNHLPRK